MEEHRFNFIKETSDTVLFNARDLIIPGKYAFYPTIWQRQEVYYMFTSSQLWSLHDEAEGLVERCEETENPTVSLVWDRGTPVNKIIAEVLLDNE